MPKAREQALTGGLLSCIKSFKIHRWLRYVLFLSSSVCVVDLHRWKMWTFLIEYAQKFSIPLLWNWASKYIAGTCLLYGVTLDIFPTVSRLHTCRRTVYLPPYTLPSGGEHYWICLSKAAGNGLRGRSFFFLFQRATAATHSTWPDCLEPLIELRWKIYPRKSIMTITTTGSGGKVTCFSRKVGSCAVLFFAFKCTLSSSFWILSES